MSYSDDIRTIAKTQELLDKANKALKVAEEAKKDAIDTQRMVAQQRPNAGPTSVGNNGSGDTSDGTNAQGDPVLPPLAPPPSPKPGNNTNTNTTDSYGNGINNSGTGTSAGNKSNDLSNNGSQYNPNDTGSNAGGSRTDSKKQADPDNAGDPDWEQIQQALEDSGASPEYIAEMRRQYFLAEQGKHEISDVYNGDAGPKPTEGTWTGYAPNGTGGNQDSMSSLVHGLREVINAVVGVDPNDPNTAIEIRFDNKSILPSIAEASAAGQNTWTSTSTAPIKKGWEFWEQGFYYRSQHDVFNKQHDAPTKYLAALSLAQATVGYVSPSFGYIIEDYRNLTNAGGSDTQPGDYDVEFYYNWDNTSFPINTGWANYRMTVSKLSCVTFPNADMCVIDPARESAWPPVGLYVLSLIGGQFLYSIFDSEVPLRYKGISSAVNIKSAIDDNTYSIEPAIEGGFIINNITDNQGYFLYYGADRSLHAIVPINQYKFYTPR